jgi:NAD(P)-dependent dehydrogenase (short-subunit alcohol dehydrogenase family)
MKDFAGKIAVVTGGSGMGRELIRQLVAQACTVAMCDVSAPAMVETQRLCEAAGLPQGLRITTHVADVSDAAQVQRFRDEVADRHDTDKIHLLFNNTSSVNGFWASVGPRVPHTAYSAAKFAVKGFTEALITDLRINAPHIKCSVVMPGHIGTSIPLNSRKIQSGNQSNAMDATQIAQARARIASTGREVSDLSDEDIRKMVAERERRFREEAPTTAAAAATIILDGVKADRWRILVGDDAHRLDDLVRRSPEQAYDLDFFERFAREAGWQVGP